jgi:hypothetical protein
MLEASLLVEKSALTASPCAARSIVLGIRMVVCDEHHKWKVQRPLPHCSRPRGTGVIPRFSSITDFFNTRRAHA